MASAIRGITVEIGGNTTKLDKALEGVNKRSRDLSSELSQVNKLLKMDPGNTDLLAQKQKILAGAISETKDKLNTLKSAEAQVQEQFKRGEVSEAQVRALQREIITVTQKLKSYEQAAEETARALDNMGDDTKEAVKGAKDVDKESDKAADALDDLAKSADEAGNAGEGLGSKLKNAAKVGISAVATAATALVGALAGSAEATREYRTEMGKLEAAFDSSGHSAETASATFKTLQGIIGETDQSVEAAQQIALLASSEEDAAKWADQAAGVVGKFGDALQPETFFESANETLKLGEATGAYTQMLEGCGISVEEFNAGLAACSTEAEKQAYMLSVTEGALGAAGRAYKENNAEIIRANEASNTWAATMADVGAAVEPILTDVKLLAASLLKDLLPGIKQITEAFRGIINGEAGAANKLGSALSGIISDLLTKITELAPTIVNVGMSLITTLVTSLIGMLPQLVTTGVELILTVVNGITQAIPQFTAAIVRMIPILVQALADGIPQLIRAGVDFFLAIVQAIPQVLPPLISAIPNLVTSVITGLLTAVPQLIQGALQFWTAIIQAIPVVVPQLVAAIPTLVTNLVTGLLANMPTLLQGAVTLFSALVQAISQIIPGITGALPTIIITLVDGLIDAIPELLHGATLLLDAIVQAIPILIEALVPEIPTIVDTIVKKLGEMVPVLLSAAIKLFFAIVDAIPQIVTSLIRNLPQILQAISSVLGAIPDLLWEILFEAIAHFGTFGREAFNRSKSSAKNIVNAIVNGIKSLPDNIKTIGSDLVKGLWNGINDMVGWITGKIEGFGESVLKGIKNFFGIKSPSRLMRDQVGKYVAQGIASGIEENADDPINAVKKLGEDMANTDIDLNGATINRKLNTTFSAGSVNNASSISAVLSRLDRLYERLDRFKVVLDSGETVGALVDTIDGALSDRYDKLARGW